MITFDRLQFAKTLAMCEKLSSRCFQPILHDYALVRVLNDVQAELVCTDTEVTLRVQFDAISDNSSECLVPIHALHDLAQLEHDACLAIEPGEERVAIQASANYSFCTVRPSDYPAITEEKMTTAWSISAQAFYWAIKRARFVIDSRAHRGINGALLEFKGKDLTICTTDGRRLSVIELQCMAHQEKKTSYLLPVRALDLLMIMLKGCSDSDVLEIGGVRQQRAVFRLPSYELSTVLVDSKFPHYRDVIADISPQITYQVLSSALLNALKRCMIAATKDTPGVIFDYDHGSLTLSVDTERGRVVSNIACEGGAGKVSVLLNGNYVQQYLRYADVGRPVTVQIPLLTRPVIFSQDEFYRYYLMPMVPTGMGT